MPLSHFVNIFNQISESIGLPPIVLICTIALFFFIFIFGLLILIKVRSIRKDLLIINRNFDSLNRSIQEKMASLKTEKLNRDQDKNSSDFREEEFLDMYKGNSDIKSELLSLLKITNGPMSYSEIAKHLSKNSSDYDFESILKELDQLKNEGKVIGQVSAGKIYFQIKK